MKKIFFASGFITLVCVLCFAGRSPVSAAGEFKTTTGRVDAITIMEGEMSQMTIRGSGGFPDVFKIAVDAKITNAEGNPTNLNWVKGNKVFIEYIMIPGGLKLAKTIKVLRGY